MLSLGGWLAGWLGGTQVVQLLTEEGHRLARVSVRLVADPEMAQSHQSYSGVDGTTDVLAFVDTANPLEIDILACIDEARRKAQEFAHDFMHELILYIVHALLHGLGHDDQEEASSMRMHAQEDALLVRAGIGAVFDPARREGEAR